MHVGMSVLFQNVDDRLGDDEVYRNELALADLGEPLGYQSIWGVEHHFTSYTMCPDVLQFLTWVAARTEHCQVGSMVVVLPWHDPVRVAEEVAMLDIMSGGRFVFGMGRGLGRIEFEGMRVPMGESRDRFVDAARVVIDGLERGWVEHSGRFWDIPRRDVRPRPPKSFRGRTYAAAVSPESMTIMAELGVGLLIIPQKPWDAIEEDLRQYRTVYREVQGSDPPAPIIAGWVYCHEDERTATEAGIGYLGNYYRSVIAHYEIGGSHFATTKGYDYYSLQSGWLNDLGADTLQRGFADLQFYGTPDQVHDKVLQACQRTGAETFLIVPSFGGMAPDDAERNLRLFAESVKPRLQAAGGAAAVAGP